MWETIHWGVVRKMVVIAALVMVCIISVSGLTSCGTGDKEESGSGAKSGGVISVISREDGSGTRGAFTDLLKIEDADGKDATTADAVITNSTATVMTTVAGDPAGIGYISLGSLNDTVKALEIDDVAPSVETVKDGSYAVARPFNVVSSGKTSDTAKDFLNFVLSADGQAIVEENGYVSAVDGAKPYTPGQNLGDKVTVAGSSSVTPVMEKLAEGYQKKNPNIAVEVQQSDSSTGIQSAIDGICDLGMSSRELKDSEASQGITPTVIAMDGIAVIVNKDSAVSGLTADQVRSIYMGEVTDWSEVA